MTALLEQAFSKVSELSEAQQNKIASRLLQELAEEYAIELPEKAYRHVERRGTNLYITGTRITLYLIMDYLMADWSREKIRETHSLTDEQIDEVLAFISEHQVQIVREYEEVQRFAEEKKRYWHKRNREQLATIHSLPPRPGHEEARRRIEQRKAELGME